MSSDAGPSDYSRGLGITSDLLPDSNVMENLPPNSNIGPVARTTNSSNPQAQRHATLFYLSLIEGRCRSHAVKEINSQRRPQHQQLSEEHPEVQALASVLFTRMSTELKQRGLIPQDVNIPKLEDLRPYLDTFDAALFNITSNVLQQSESAGYSLSEIEHSPGSRSNVLIPVQLPYQGPLSTGPLSRIQLKTGDSHYEKYFKELRLLGKGGFGQVFCAQHVLENRQYAVKKIRISAAQLRSIKSDLHGQTLLAELQALANLQQRNVVRFFHSWVEVSPATARSSQGLLAGKAYSFSESSSKDSPFRTRDEVNTNTLQDLHIDFEEELKEDDWRKQRSSHTQSEDMIVFEVSNSAQITANDSKSTTGSKSSKRKALFRQPSDVQSESTEELTRTYDDTEPAKESDMVIFIQMDLHPMTLEDYLWPDQERVSHCYHNYTTARIVLAILDGIEYIHSQQIVHRDLKPSNIFLSIHEKNVEGAIDITACPECTGFDKNVYIIPHIGDFGLIAKLEDPENLATSPTSSSKPFKPSPMAVLSSKAASHQLGTRFYCAPDTQHIGPKLDIYSLGVILFEMLCKFGTKSERQVVLGKLTQEENLPAELENHAMEPAVRGMLERDREKRWDCAKVRSFLGDFVCKDPAHLFPV